jgi:hypothetical protein
MATNAAEYSENHVVDASAIVRGVFPPKVSFVSNSSFLLFVNALIVVVPTLEYANRLEAAEEKERKAKATKKGKGVVLVVGPVAGPPSSSKAAIRTLVFFFQLRSSADEDFRSRYSQCHCGGGRVPRRLVGPFR